MKKVLLITAILSILFLIGGCTEGTKTASGLNTENKEITGKTDYVTVEEAAETALKVGDKMPAFELPNSKSEMVKSEALLKDSNLVVVFYRGDWCPYCNMYLKRLQQSNKDFIANNAKLVAISVESPNDSLSVAEKNNLDFLVLSDKNLDLARKFKIVYELPPKTDAKYKEKGIDLIKDNGTMKPELPLSATYIINQKGEITYAFLDPDYTKRLESDEINKQLKKLTSESDANKVKE